MINNVKEHKCKKIIENTFQPMFKGNKTFIFTILNFIQNNL